MKKLLLSEIAGAVNGKAVGECEIQNISIDSRKIEENSLYVAIIGEKFDGHIFCKKAEESGAKALLVSKIPEDTNLPYVLTENTEKAFLKLAEYYISELNLIKVAVTGSVGKTTTKEMIYAVLNEKYKTLKTEGNLNNQIGLPKTVFRLDNSVEAAVLELGMGNFGEISALSKAVNPDIGVITKIGVSHMETLGSREGIMKAKLEVLDGMKVGTPLFVSSDDEYLGNYTNPNHPVIKFGIHNDAYYMAKNIAENGYTTEFTVVFNENSQKLVIPTVGEHNVYNALAAFAVGVECNVTPLDIAKGLANYKPSGMRQNMVVKNGITVIEDCYNASPDSMDAALKVLNGINTEKGKKIAVLADMLELGHISQDAHFKVGELVSKSNTDILLCFGPESEQIFKGAKEKGMKEVYHFSDKNLLNEMLCKTVLRGDAILFKGSRAMALEDSINFLYNFLDK